jgi:actin-related protein
VQLKVVCPPEPALAPWRGGSIVSLLDKFQQIIITKKEFAEAGDAIVARKLF